MGRHGTRVSIAKQCKWVPSLLHSLLCQCHIYSSFVSCSSCYHYSFSLSDYGWPSSDEQKLPVDHITEEHRRLIAEKCSDPELNPNPDMPDLLLAPGLLPEPETQAAEKVRLQAVRDEMIKKSCRRLTVLGHMDQQQREYHTALRVYCTMK